MLYDVTWLQKAIATLVFIILWTLCCYFTGYSSGEQDTIIKYQKEAMQIVEESNHSAIIVQQEMEKTDAQMEHASTVSDDCNYVLNFDLTPCGVFK